MPRCDVAQSLAGGIRMGVGHHAFRTADPMTRTDTFFPQRMSAFEVRRSICYYIAQHGQEPPSSWTSDLAAGAQTTTGYVAEVVDEEKGR
jgi:hypothetical protein